MHVYISASMAVVVWFIAAQLHLLALDARVANASSELTELKTQAAARDERVLACKSLRERLASIQAMSDSAPSQTLLALVSAVVPESVRVTSLAVDYPGPTVLKDAADAARNTKVPMPASIVRITLDGRAPDHGTLNVIVHALSQYQITAVSIDLCRDVSICGRTESEFRLTIRIPATDVPHTHNGTQPS